MQLAGSGGNGPTPPPGLVAVIRFLVDISAPTISNPSTITNAVLLGQLLALTALYTDNVDLYEAQLGMQFALAHSLFAGGFVYLPLYWQSLGDGFGRALTVQQLVTWNVLLPLALYLADPSGFFPASPILPRAIMYTGRDVARRWAALTFATFLTSLLPPASTLTQVLRIEFLASALLACDGSAGSCGATPTSTTLTARIHSPNTVAPLLALTFYAITQAGFVRPLCTATNPAAALVNAVWVYTYACAYNWKHKWIDPVGPLTLFVAGLVTGNQALIKSYFLNLQLRGAELAIKVP
jgi:hypothetical protein